MSFLVMPPEVSSTLMYSGLGSAPMLEAAAAWETLSSELGAAASSFSSVTSGLAGQAWQGPASQAMLAAAVPYAGWLSDAAANASDAAQQARTVASVFESARAAMVHPLAVTANRNGLVQLVMSNLFGQNAPAIAATESEYEQVWAQDVGAMLGYHSGALAAAAALPALKVLIKLAKLGKLAYKTGKKAAKLGEGIGDLVDILKNKGPQTEKEILQYLEQQVAAQGGHLPQVPGQALRYVEADIRKLIPHGQRIVIK